MENNICVCGCPAAIHDYYGCLNCWNKTPGCPTFVPAPKPEDRGEDVCRAVDCKMLGFYRDESGHGHCAVCAEMKRKTCFHYVAPQKTLKGNPESWEERFEDFAIINEFYIRGFPVGKMKAFFVDELHKAEQEARADERKKMLNEQAKTTVELIYAEARKKTIEDFEKIIQEVWKGIWDYPIKNFKEIFKSTTSSDAQRIANEIANKFQENLLLKLKELIRTT